MGIGIADRDRLSQWYTIEHIDTGIGNAYTRY